MTPASADDSRSGPDSPSAVDPGSEATTSSAVISPGTDPRAVIEVLATTMLTDDGR